MMDVTERAALYQVVMPDGKTKQVLDLTREELILELVDTMDKMEEIEELRYKLGNLLQDWRDGK